jgi:hypothetical protein
MLKTYLYLLKRNKKDVKIIGIVNSDNLVNSTRLNDAILASFAAQDRLGIKEVMNNHQLEWDAWIESAEGYVSLKNNLHKRGVSAPPSAGIPLLNLESKELSKQTLSRLNKTMIRRKD